MGITIEIDEVFVTKVNPAPITEALRHTIRRFNKSIILASGLNIIITDETTVQQLNQQYRGINTPTDVLSFENNLDPDFPVMDPVANNHLGDIIIAYPVAETQAISRGHTPLDELILLAVHGTLHLLGFDHDTSKNKEEMWAAQQQIMADMNLGHVQPTEH